MNAQEVRANCDHHPRRTDDTTCVRCGFPLPAWHLTEAYARQVYDAIGLDYLADHAVGRLRMGGRDYGKWLAYLERENSPEAVDELVDVVHYAIFDSLRSYKLEAEGLPADRAERARAHLARGAEKVRELVAEFEAAARELKD